MTFSKNTSQFPHHFVHAGQKTLNASHTKWSLSGPDDDEIVQNARTENGATGCLCSCCLLLLLLMVLLPCACFFLKKISILFVLFLLLLLSLWLSFVVLFFIVFCCRRWRWWWLWWWWWWWWCCQCWCEQYVWFQHIYSNIYHLDPLKLEAEWDILIHKSTFYFHLVSMLFHLFRLRNGAMHLATCKLLASGSLHWLLPSQLLGALSNASRACRHDGPARVNGWCA